MQVVVASQNPAKLRAVEDAFRARWPDTPWTITGVDVPSGVADQPVGDDETWRGADNRARAAARAHPEAAYGVGLEGGIDTLHGQVCTFAWIVVRHRDGRRSQSRCTSLPLPRNVTELLDQGLELGHACDRAFGTDNIKQKGGAIGLLTGDLYTRSGTYTQAAVFALAAFDSRSHGKLGSCA